AVPDGVRQYRVTAVDRYGADGEPGSAEARVGDATPPAVPTLTATVAGSDVLLSWDAAPDADHFVLTRDGAPLVTTSESGYPDRGRPNGHYVSTVRAVDAAGNESAESNPAAADVFVVPPEPPVLHGTVLSNGDIQLEWDHAGAADYAVYRWTD